jgi:hypothetical protein
MTNIDPGIQGAKRQTWDENDPRPILIRIMTEHLGASEIEIFDLFWEEIQEERPALKSMARYWCRNTFLALQPRRSVTSSVAVASASTRVVEGLKERVRYEAGIVLMELLMPNNKILGDCQRGDLLKIGGWVSALAEKMPTKKKVFEVFSEQDLHQLWKKKK